MRHSYTNYYSPLLFNRILKFEISNLSHATMFEKIMRQQWMNEWIESISRREVCFFHLLPQQSNPIDHHRSSIHHNEARTNQRGATINEQQSTSNERHRSSFWNWFHLFEIAKSSLIAIRNHQHLHLIHLSLVHLHY